LTGRFNTSLEQNPGLSDQLHELAERRNEKKYGSRELSIAEAVKAMGAERGQSAAQISLNWVRQKGTIPIIGVSKMAQLKESLDALRWSLTEEEMHALDRTSEVELGFPYDFLMSRNVKKAFWRNTFDQVDRLRPSAYVDPDRSAQ
jgi:aryl-alcohol dehydrogenase-like predicted oxidoreductase